jgi:hypothetical protein
MMKSSKSKHPMRRFGFSRPTKLTDRSVLDPSE